MALFPITDIVDMPLTIVKPSQPATGFAANRNHPRHLPTPIIPEVANMSFRQPSAGQIFEPDRHPTLPPLRQVFGDNNGPSNHDISSLRPSVDFMARPTQNGSRGRTSTTQISSAQAAEVMQKTVETLRTQIHANGFTDEDIRKARESDMQEARQANVVNTHTKTFAELTENQPQEYEADSDFQTNPYDDRADMIGLSHHMPGIGHLGTLLTPPGWKAGDPPISPKLARELYRDGYEAAKKSLADSIGEFKHLKGTTFQEASDRKNEEWRFQTDLAKLILDERIKVYHLHHEQKTQQPQHVQERLGRQMPVLQLPGLDAANLHDSPVGVSGPSQHPYGHPHPQNGFVPCNNGALLRPGNAFNLPEPSPKILSPSFLDPTLIPGTIETVIERYHAKKAEIQKMHYENETQMQQCLTRYGQLQGQAHSQVQQEPLVARHWDPGSQPHQRPLTTLQRLPYYHPVSNIRNETHEVNKNDDRPAAYHYASPPEENALGIYHGDREDEPVELALSSPLKHYDDESQTAQLQSTPQTTNEHESSSSEKVAVQKRTPRKRTAASRYAQAKKPVWYASHLENGNLPTSSISNSAIRAGLAYDPKAPKAAEANMLGTTKKRRRYGDEVPIPEFKVPPEKLRAMFASNLPMKYVGKGPNPFLAENRAGVAEENRGELLAKKKGKGKVGATSKAPVSKAQSVDIFSPKALDVSDSMDDDEKDATYGGKAKIGMPMKRGDTAIRHTSPRKAKTARMTKA
ncbi:MAG: hypothetical protein Q9169_003922 [Polycauliona sp. 2 TL-2023]